LNHLKQVSKNDNLDELRKDCTSLINELSLFPHRVSRNICLYWMDSSIRGCYNAFDFPTYQEDALLGDPWGQARLAWCYESGEGITKNYKESYKYYQLAYEQGHLDSLASIAGLYIDDHVEGKGMQEGFILLEQALKKGSLGALAKLGYYYWNGKPLTSSNINNKKKNSG